MQEMIATLDQAGFSINKTENEDPTVFTRKFTAVSKDLWLEFCWWSTISTVNYNGAFIRFNSLRTDRIWPSIEGRVLMLEYNHLVVALFPLDE